jgi:CheY-like chemotaxis protein
MARYGAAQMLLKQGYEVLLATDGQMALDIYEREKDKIDAVLLDIGLPQAGRARCADQNEREEPGC